MTRLVNSIVPELRFCYETHFSRKTVSHLVTDSEVSIVQLLPSVSA